MKRPFAAAALVFAVTTGMAGASLPSGFTETSWSGITNPTAMAIAPDGRVFVCQQGGAMRVIKNGTLLPTPFVSLSVDSNGERGLLGVAFDPNFLFTQYVYVYYTVPGSPPHNRLSRFTANGDVATAGSELILLELNNLSSATNHNGGAIHFGADGKLYVAVGDNATGSNSQTLSNLLGKVLRVGVPPDPLIPTDNPFFGTATGNNRAIWALGLRNPFTFNVQPVTGRIFVNDVGENTWEEINDANPGNNFGWPTCEGDCNNPSYEDPFYTYNHASACSIAGGAFYNPDVPQFPATYVGKYFFADYCGDYIKYVDPNSGSPSATTFATGLSSPVDVQTDFNGYLYYLNRGENRVYRVSYTGSNAPTITENPQSQLISTGHPVTFTVAASGQAPLSYQWQRNSVDIGLATLSSYTIGSVGAGDDGDQFRCIVSNGVLPNATSAQATLTVTSNQPPAATISSPTAGTTYGGGDTIAYSGSASDPETGALPASSFTWWVNFHHDTHFHPFLQPTSGETGGSITIPTVGETSSDVWYRIHLQVVDPAGLTDETYVDLIPRTTTMTLTTNPNGLQLTLDGQPFTSPLDVVGVEGIQRTIGAPSPQSSGGNTYNYVSWSDGGLQTHAISTPASDTTYTALFTSGPTPTSTRTNTPTMTRTPTRTATRTSTPTASPTPPSGSLPPPWAQQDIGSPGVPGSGGFAAGVFAVSGSGFDIEDTSDQFHYVYQTLNGDGTVQARVATQQNTDPWAKSGVMIRETLAANSKHAMMVTTPSNGLLFQRRTSTGGATSTTFGAAVAAPYWVRVVRSGSSFSGYSSPDGVTWTLVGSSTITMSTSVVVGLPVTSHNNSLLGTSTFDNVSVTPTITPTPSFTATRTNTPTASNTATQTRTASVTPSRTNTPTSTPSQTATRTPSQTPTGSATATRTATLTASATSTATATRTVTATASRTSTATATRTATATASRTATATPSRTPTATATQPAGLPPPWAGQDVGAVGLPGSATYSSGAFGVHASGADIEENSDQFHYVYQPLTGDGTIQARVLSIEETDPWAKGGVMIRETLAPDSKHAMVALTPDNGLVLQWRGTTGGTTSTTFGPATAAPYWVRVVRTGSTLSGYSSPDGVNWTPVGSATVSMTSGVFVGLPLTSHDNSELCSATLDNVVFSPTITPTPSHTATRTFTSTPSQTPTSSPTASRTPTFTPTVTASNTPSVTLSVTVTASQTPTRTPTVTNTVTPAAPSVSSIAPTSGPAAAGTGVSVAGSSFQPGATLKIGGASATGVVVVGGSQITGSTPALSAGHAERRDRDQPRQSRVDSGEGLVRGLRRRPAGQSVPRRHRDGLP